MVFLQLWRQSPIHAIRLMPDRRPPERVWVTEKPGPQEPSPVYYRGLLYVLMDGGVLACLDGRTGSELYRERLGGACNSSPVAADGRIYLANNDGVVFVVKAGPRFELLSANSSARGLQLRPPYPARIILSHRLRYLLHRGRPVTDLPHACDPDGRESVAVARNFSRRVKAPEPAVLKARRRWSGRRPDSRIRLHDGLPSRSRGFANQDVKVRVRLPYSLRGRVA